MHTIIIKFPFAFFKLVSNDVFLNYLNFHNDNNNDFDNIELRNMLKTIIQTIEEVRISKSSSYDIKKKLTIFNDGA